jgi:hypothetical protein
VATTTAQATGTTTPDNWSLEAGASKAAAVASPDDDATSYIGSTTTSNTYQYFTCSPGLGAGDTVTQVQVVARARRSGVNDTAVRVGYQFTPQGGGSQTGESALGDMTATSAWQTFTYTHSGLSVLWGSGFVFWIRNAQARRADCSTLYVVITYTPAAGGGQAVKAMHYARMME